MDIRPILYPTVPEGEERLRIALHSFNTLTEVADLIAGLGQ
jgi:8-amino-7-oxononanoate synthase